MALTIFRSRAAGEIYMFAETARHIFDVLGRPMAERGVITADQVAEALTRLQSAVDAERAERDAAQRAADDAESRREPGAAARPISLGQRAFPLIEMLQSAQKRGVDVTWGV